jgi:hypothetical protein
MLITSGHLTSALIVTQQHVASLRDDADQGYRQIARLPTHAAQPTELRRPRCEQQLVIVARGPAPMASRSLNLTASDS